VVLAKSVQFLGILPSGGKESSQQVLSTSLDTRPGTHLSHELWITTVMG